MSDIDLAEALRQALTWIESHVNAPQMKTASGIISDVAELLEKRGNPEAVRVTVDELAHLMELSRPIYTPPRYVHLALKNKGLLEHVHMSRPGKRDFGYTRLTIKGQYHVHLYLNKELEMLEIIPEGSDDEA